MLQKFHPATAAHISILRAGMTLALIASLASTAASAAGRPEPAAQFAAVRPVAPPPDPVNFYVDSQSEQTIAGQKTFTAPIAGNLSGNATTADAFTGALWGDVRGTQAFTQIVNVPLTALPSIGFGYYANTAKVKYVSGDAHPADTRRDGSIAHPYASVAVAAAAANDGDRFILTGALSGDAVFARSVTVEGGSPDQTTFSGTLEFSGAAASHLRNLRVNCASDRACVGNRSAAGVALALDHVAVNQGGSGAALESESGPLSASDSEFNGLANGPAVRAGNASLAESRFADCRVNAAESAPGLLITGGSVVIAGGTYSAAAAAIQLVGGSLQVSDARLVSSSSPLIVADTGRITVTGSLIEAGAGSSAVSLNIPPVVSFAADTPMPTFMQNQFITDAGVPSIACKQKVTLLSSGNYNLKNTGVPPSAAFGGTCHLQPLETF